MAIRVALMMLLLCYFALLFISVVSPLYAAPRKTFFEILGVGKNADAKTIKKCYRDLAVRWHPDKNPDNKKVAEERFKEINEAYETLSDVKKREAYEEQLKYGAGPQRSAVGGFGRKGFRTSSMFHGMDTHSPFGFTSSQGQGSSHQGDVNDIMDMLSGMFSGPRSAQAFTSRRQSSGTGHRFPSSSSPSKTVTSKVNVSCTLAELYAGCQKTVIVRPSDATLSIPSRTIQVNIAPGWRTGTKLKYVFREKGAAYGTSGMFVHKVEITVVEKPHRYLKRIGDNLYWTCGITSSQAAKGVRVRLPLLTNATHCHPLDNADLTQKETKYVIEPGVVDVLTFSSLDIPLSSASVTNSNIIKIQGLGMPLSKKGKRTDSSGADTMVTGSLFVKLEVKD